MLVPAGLRMNRVPLTHTIYLLEVMVPLLDMILKQTFVKYVASNKNTNTWQQIESKQK